MNSMFFKHLLLQSLVAPSTMGKTGNSQISYLIAAIIALFILGYLLYTLVKPEKF